MTLTKTRGTCSQAAQPLTIIIIAAAQRWVGAGHFEEEEESRQKSRLVGKIFILNFQI